MDVLKKLIPTPIEIGREAIIVAAGVTVAALVIKMWPKWSDYIQGASITVKDERGNVLW